MSLDEKSWQKKLKRKRKAPARQKPLLPRMEAYSAAQAAHLPIHDSRAPKDLFESGLGMVFLTRTLPGGELAISAFLVDTFCLGVKNAFYRVVSTQEYEQIAQQFDLEKIHPSCLRKLVEGAIDYALELGFKPHSDYAGAARLFGNIEASVCPVRFSYGKDGKPCYISGPDDSPAHSRRILDILKRRLGAEGFSFMTASGATADELASLAPESVSNFSYDITEDALPDPAFERLPVAVQDRINVLHDELRTRPELSSTLIALKELIQQYPDLPQLYNYLYIAYYKLGKQEEAARVLQETVQHFPNYLFGRIAWANECLKRGEPEKVADIFEEKFDLQLHYPQRNLFHLSEFISFQSVLARYFYAIGDNKRAQIHYDIMYQMAPEHEHTRLVGRTLHPSPLGGWMKGKLKLPWH
jgi:tetratricopeptide (TPR) repeat protein